MENKWKLLFRNSIGYLTIFLVSVVYVATTFITITETQKTMSQILADGIISFVMGILINRLFDTQGIMNGDRDEKVLKTIKYHGDVVERCTPLLDRLDPWCERKNKEALMRARRYFLSRHGIKYQEFFDQDGVAVPLIIPDKLGCFKTFARKYYYWRAVNLHVTQISSGILISDSGKVEDPFFMGRSKPEYMKTTTRKDMLTKLITAILFGYYGVSLIQEFSIATLIWTVLQLVIFLAMGVIKMQQSYLYVTDEYRGRIIKKIDILQLFEIETKNESYQEEHRNGSCEEPREYDQGDRICQDNQSGD